MFEARKILAAYRGLPETRHKQMGVRAAREAALLAQRNPERANECLARAKFHLTYAQAWAERLNEKGA